MTRRPLAITDRLHEYVLANSLREPPAVARLRERTAALPDPDMQIAPEQGQFMALLVELIGARHILEIGCFTGYSTLWMALALPDDGRLATLDLSREWTEIGRAAWREAGVEDRIEVRLGPALASLDRLVAEGAAESFDIAFIDADKENYDAYYERTLVLVRRGGLILIDNMLWGGTVADPETPDHQTQALQELARKLHADQRISLSLLPIADGLALARKR